MVPQELFPCCFDDPSFSSDDPDLLLLLLELISYPISRKQQRGSLEAAKNKQAASESLSLRASVGVQVGAIGPVLGDRPNPYLADHEWAC